MMTPIQLASHLMGPAMAQYRNRCGQGLNVVGEAVQRRVEEKIGYYQPAVGPYNAWAPLAAATLERKALYGQGMGGNPDTPLYATGRFANSVEHQVQLNVLAVHIGTNVPYIKYNEYGVTGRIPPRPIFAPAGEEVIPQMLPVLGNLAAAGVASNPGLMYNRL